MVHLTGSRLGGRNQELALSATHGLAGLFGAAVSSVGLDDTDGPMKVAGGYTDGDTTATLHARGLGNL
ncbi:MAG: MOFRL family protein [Ruthenibacterium lactatiformans]